NRLEAMGENLEEGDIAGITTDIEGLAIMHVVILVPANDGIHLMHASSAAGEVILSDETLSMYLQQHQRATGIMVARPI
ncbi:MAG: N-acetylmuramoyl-L-alanine amidase-like domain-containing protein, partial [Bacteroidales bacterium]